jgi:hypothetical protein
MPFGAYRGELKMSWDFFIVTTQVARKDYKCDAAEWLGNMMCDDDFTLDELPIIKKAESEKWKILKGTVYSKTSGKWDGDFSVFRARPELDELCLKYDLYQD